MAALGETSAAFKPGASATGPWTDAMLKPSGILVRDYILSKAKQTEMGMGVVSPGKKGG